MEVPNGALVTEKDGRLSVTHPSGEVELRPVPPECHDDAARLAAERKAKKATSGIADGWLDYGGYYSEQGRDSLKSFTGSYTIPAAPKTVGDQTIYYFIGMQDNGDRAVNIVQPVLTFGQPVNGQGPASWNVASWCCCPSNITTHSHSVGPLKPGDVLKTLIERDDASTWTIDAITPSQQHATLKVDVGDYIYNWADVTLEVYKVQTCDQLPSGVATFSNMSLTGKDGPTKPVWTFTHPTACNGKIGGDAQTVTIQHN